jgi:geranylgeranyl pyrophosphate synthase
MTGLPGFFAVITHRAASESLPRVRQGGPVERAMAYPLALKQVRAVLVLLCAELCRGTAAQAIPAAVAIELVHASSLVLDDLPSMDDAPLRRGRRANHLESGKRSRDLAAFGLLNLAYGASRAPTSRRWRRECQSCPRPFVRRPIGGRRSTAATDPNQLRNV